MTLANEYVAVRKDNLSKPSSWLRSYREELEADPHDLFHLSYANYHPDGLTVTFRDKSKALKATRFRRTK